MKPLIVKSTFFLLIFFIIDQTIFQIYRYEILDQPYSYGALSRMYAGSINTDIVMFGSSRTMLHLDPSVIENETNLSAYNLGKDGTNMYQSFFTLKEYLIYNKKPKLIIFEADLMQFRKNGTLRFEKEEFRGYSFLSKRAADLFDQTLIERISRKLVKSQFAANKLNSFYSFFTKTVFGKKEKETKIMDFGDWLFSSGANLKKVTDRSIKEMKEIDPQLEYSEEKFNLLGEVADFAEKQNVPILFFSPPINYWKEGEATDRGLFAIRKIASKNRYVDLADYAYDKDFSPTSPYWWNAAHLNIEGARLQTRKIVYNINKILRRSEEGTAM